MTDVTEMLRKELAAHEIECDRIRKALAILTGPEPELTPEDSYEAQERREREWMDRLEARREAAVAPVERRERHPDVQRAIETQTPSQAIPKGTALYCSEGCTTAHESGGFTDLMALRTHTKRNHDREPTEQEEVPR